MKSLSARGARTGLQRALLFVLFAVFHLDPGWAGVNQGGALLLHADPSIEFTTTRLDYCPELGSVDCASAETEVSGGETVVVFALAAFRADVSPRVRAVSFGLRYPQNVRVIAHRACADFEICEAGWPRSGYGTALSWSAVQTQPTIPVYWFAMYNAGGGSALVEIVAHGAQGATFADDTTPATLDRIEGLGSLGFDRPGATPCPGPSIPSGACCLVSGDCEFLSEEECTAVSGIYHGNSVSCETTFCTPAVGACCLPSGVCQVLNIIACSEAHGGIWIGRDIPCAPSPCPDFELTGACCFPSGACTWISGRECREQDGLFFGNVEYGACDPNPCPSPPALGSCCKLGGECVVLDRDDCQLEGGVSWSDLVLCDPSPCPQEALGPCCTPNGSCIVTTMSRCVGEEGDPIGNWLGWDTGCDPNPCPLPSGVGACCDIDGSCVIITEDLCNCTGRIYAGDGMVCDVTNCVDIVAGACCLPDGDCRLMPLDYCTANGGQYAGDDTYCDPDPCPEEPGVRAVGACCFEDGTCAVSGSVDCIAQAGRYMGDETQCDGAGCQRGVPVERSSWGAVKHRYR